MSEEQNTIQAIEIDPDGRYVFICEGVDYQTLARLQEQIKAWWAGDAPFAMIGHVNGATIRLEKVAGDG